jgi:hypothetical protein
MRFRPDLFVLGLLVAAVAAPAFAAPNPADYPLRVHIFTTSWNGSIYNGYHGFGRANLTDGADTHAMEYTFECNEHFMISDSGEASAAKWKKPGQAIEMLVGEIGSNKLHTCQLKVEMKDTVYARRNGLLEVLSQEDYKAREANREQHNAAIAPVDADPAHYPLQLAVLDMDWGEAMGGIVRGSGHANVRSGSEISSMDFVAECPVKFKATPDGRYFYAKWTREGSDMQILMHKLGDPTQAATCNLKTSVHTDVYVMQSAGVLKAVSQEKYKTMQTNDARAVPDSQ